MYLCFVLYFRTGEKMLGVEKIRELLQATSERKAPLTWSEPAIFGGFLPDFYFADYFTLSRGFSVLQ